MSDISPIVENGKTELISEYTRCITSDSRLVEAHVANRICLETGLIFNGSGARGNETGFYMDEYDLHSESTYSEFTYFDQGGAAGIYDNIVGFVTSNLSLANSGSVMDVGCGKGILLSKFANKFPDWRLSAVEPSKNASVFFSKVMPSLNLFNGPLEKSPFLEESFDLILSNGVLEHVPDPVSFLKTLRNCMSDAGKLYIGVPNFENNHADLFTFDHLSRFTPATIKMVFAMAGFRIVHEFAPPSRVPMWFIVEKSDEIGGGPFGHMVEESRMLAKNHLTVVDEYFSSYQRCMDDSSATDRIGMYGTGAFGFLGTQYTDFAEEKLAKIYDDNQTLWGAKKLGAEIADPREMVNDGITKLLISANPCYLNDIVAKTKKIIAGSEITLYQPSI